MRTTAIVCTLLAGSLGFGSLASAQDWNGRRDRDNNNNNRWEQRQDRREARQDRREDRRDIQAGRQDRRENRAFNNGYYAGAYSQPNYVYSQPNYVYNQPRYVYNQPRFNRGGYLPYEYRSRGYYVNDWHSHGGLYAPPSGHQWMNVDGNFLLVALASGLIANALMN